MKSDIEVIKRDVNDIESAIRLNSDWFIYYNDECIAYLKVIRMHKKHLKIAKNALEREKRLERLVNFCNTGKFTQ